MAAIVTEYDDRDVPAPSPEMEAMMEAGVHWGHARSKRHPAMMPYLWGTRSNVEVIDLTKTCEKLAEALVFLSERASKGKLILFVGTRPSARHLVKETAEALGYPYVDQRWIGGTLTNFKVILKRVETLESLEQEQASGGFEKYTKKERLRKDEEMTRLRQHFDGLRRLRRIPDVIVIIDIGHDHLALSEARRLKIPVVALTDTNTDPRLVSYAIPSNDDARPAVRYMLERMKAALREGQEHPAAPPGEAPVIPPAEKVADPEGVNAVPSAQ